MASMLAAETLQCCMSLE